MIRIREKESDWIRTESLRKGLENASREPIDRLRTELGEKTLQSYHEYRSSAVFRTRRVASTAVACLDRAAGWGMGPDFIAFRRSILKITSIVPDSRARSCYPLLSIQPI